MARFMTRKDRIALITQSFKYQQLCAEDDDSGSKSYDEYEYTSDDDSTGSVSDFDSEFSDSDLAGDQDVMSRPTLDRNTELLSPGRPGLCENVTPREKTWTTEPKYNFGSSDQQRPAGFLSRLALVCTDAQISRCKQHYKEYERLERVAPTIPKSGSWREFRCWAITAMACQRAMEGDLDAKIETDDWKNLSALCLSPSYTHVSNAVNALCTVFKVCRASDTDLFYPYLQPTDDEIDLNSVMNMIFWMAKIQGNKRIGPRKFGHWTATTLPSLMTQPSMARALEDVKDLGVCQHRLWKLLDISDRKQADLPSLVEEIRAQNEMLKHEGHGNCVADKCQFSSVDTGSIRQLHKCTLSHCKGLEHRRCAPHKCLINRSSCSSITFPVNRLLAALEQDTSTAWDVRDLTRHLTLSHPGDKHLAISHVWADGTGAGGGAIGIVNLCLLQFFTQIANVLGCNALWWDLVSIPEQSTARSKALNKMHCNYASANATIVHDTYLLSVPWKEDGSPCLAIVLSSWFTRGWTALELSMSRRVKFLFKYPREADRPRRDQREHICFDFNGAKYVIKDLDDDILAKSPSDASRMHWLATEKIKQLRKPVEDVGELLQILSPRSTSFPRDRTKIAALLADVPNCNFTRTESDITMDVVRYLGKMPQTCLLHGNPTIKDSGGFSWCTSTLDGMPIDSSKDIGDELATHTLTIEEDGCAVGLWDCQELSKLVFKPYGNNLAVTTAIAIALTKRDELLLLKPLNVIENRGLLVRPTHVKSEIGGPTTCCQYVGTVLVDSQSSESDPYNGSITCMVQIGRGEKTIPASEAMARVRNIRTTSANYDVDPQVGSQSLAQQDLDQRLDTLDGEQQDESARLAKAVTKKDKDVTRWLLRKGVLLNTSQLDLLVATARRNRLVDLTGVTMLGEILAEREEHSKAMAIFVKVLLEYRDAESRKDTFSLLDKYRATYSLGCVYKARGNGEDLEKAKQSFKRVIAACGNEGNIRSSLGTKQKKDTAQRQTLRGRSSIPTRSNAAKNIKKKEMVMNHAAQWTRLLLNAIGELTMLLLSQHKIDLANESFLLAIQSATKTSSLAMKMFELDWLDRQTDLFHTRNAKQIDFVRIYEKALQDFSVRFHRRHVLVVLTCLHLASVYHHGSDHARLLGDMSQNNLLRAEDLLKQAEEGLSEYSGFEKHPVLAIVRYHLGKVYAKRCNHGDAVLKCEDALKTLNAISATERREWQHLWILIRIALGSAQLELKRNVTNSPFRAKGIYVDFCKIVVDVAGTDRRSIPPKVAVCLGAESTVGAVNAALLGNHDMGSVKGNCLKAIAQIDSVFFDSKEYPIQRCELHAALARYHLRTDDLKEARRAAGESFEWYKKLSGETSLASCNAARLMGDTYLREHELPAAKSRNNVNYAEATLWLDQAAKGYDSVLGRHHDQTLITYQDLGHMYLNQKNYQEAERCYGHAANGFLDLLGSGSKVTEKAIKLHEQTKLQHLRIQLEQSS